MQSDSLLNELQELWWQQAQSDFELFQHIRSSDRDRIAKIFGFTRYSDFKHSIKSCVMLAHNIENLSPDLANDGPNPEFPWPHTIPVNSPVNHNFPIWSELKRHQGRKFQKFMQRAIQQFPHYADI